jgi:hypothetical protein
MFAPIVAVAEKRPTRPQEHLNVYPAGTQPKQNAVDSEKFKPLHDAFKIIDLGKR